MRPQSCPSRCRKCSLQCRCRSSLNCGGSGICLWPLIWSVRRSLQVLLLRLPCTSIREGVYFAFDLFNFWAAVWQAPTAGVRLVAHHGAAGPKGTAAAAAPQRAAGRPVRLRSSRSRRARRLLLCRSRCRTSPSTLWSRPGLPHGRHPRSGTGLRTRPATTSRPDYQPAGGQEVAASHSLSLHFGAARLRAISTILAF